MLLNALSYLPHGVFGVVGQPQGLILDCLRNALPWPESHCRGNDDDEQQGEGEAQGHQRAQPWGQGCTPGPTNVHNPYCGAIYEDILGEAHRIADSRSGFVEADIISLDDPERPW
jgi:hypothetical protein